MLKVDKLYLLVCYIIIINTSYVSTTETLPILKTLCNSTTQYALSVLRCNNNEIAIKIEFMATCY